MLFQRNQMQGTAGCHLHTDGRTHPVSGVNHQVGECKWCTRVVQAPIPVVLQIVGVQLLNIHLRYKQPVYDQSGQEPYNRIKLTILHNNPISLHPPQVCIHTPSHGDIQVPL